MRDLIPIFYVHQACCDCVRVQHFSYVAKEVENDNRGLSRSAAKSAGNYSRSRHENDVIRFVAARKTSGVMTLQCKQQTTVHVIWAVTLMG